MTFRTRVQRLAALFAFALAARAQTPLTSVVDTIFDGAGQKVTGSCTYRLASGRAVGAADAQIVGEPVTVRFTNGAFSASIVPTDTALPATQYYSVACSGNRGWSKTGNWLVVTSTDPLKWRDIWAATPPTPGIMIPLSQISLIGATEGSCLKVVSGVLAWAACGGTGITTWSVMTSAWSSYTGAWSSYQ